MSHTGANEGRCLEDIMQGDNSTVQSERHTHRSQVRVSGSGDWCGENFCRKVRGRVDF